MSEAPANASRRGFLRGRFRTEPVETPAQPETWQMPRARILPNCLAERQVECRICGEICEVQAIRFRPRLGGMVKPELSHEQCTGCGECLPVCPTQAIELFEAAEVAVSPEGVTLPTGEHT